MRKWFLVFFLAAIFFQLTAHRSYASVLFQDSFTDTNGTSLESHNPLWVSTESTATIESNELQFGSYGGYYLNMPQLDSTTDQCAQLDVSFPVEIMSIAVRTLQTSRIETNDYEIYVAGNTWYLFKYFNGTRTQFASGDASNWSGMHTLKVCAIGTTIAAYLDSNNLATATDSDIASGSFFLYSHNSLVDNFVYTGNQPNIAPAVNSLSNTTINEGDTYTTNGSFTDSDSTSWTATVDYGDGGGAQTLSLNSDKTFSLSHVYNTAGTFTVTVSVTDNQGATGTATATITVVATTTVNFDDISPNTHLDGTYSGIDWGTGVWDVDGSIPTDATNSLSFRSNSVTSGTFSFLAPSILLSTGIYSHSNQTALITLSCSGNNPVSMQVAPNSSATLTTNWTTACTTVTVTSSNGWNTNLDNLVYSSIQNPGVTPNPTPTPPPGPTGGNTTQGALLDTGDAHNMNGTKFTTNGSGGTATSMSVFVGNVDSGTHNKYQMAIYTDSSGNPGTLVAKTASGTLTPLAWNNLPITATLSANTTYWLMYNTNATTSTDYLNNMYFDNGTIGIAAYASHNFGSWPNTFPTSTLTNTNFSLYVTY